MNPRLQITLPEDMYEQIHELSEELDTSMSKVCLDCVRIGLGEYMNNLGLNPPMEQMDDSQTVGMLLNAALKKFTELQQSHGVKG